MSNISNEELAKLAQNGDKNAMAELWEATRYLIYKLMGRYSPQCERYGYTVEDLQQEGFFALVKAVEGYKPDRETKFNSYLQYPIQNIVNSALWGRNKKNPGPLLVSMDEPLPGMEDITLADTIEDETAAAEFRRVQDDWQREQLAAVMQECLAELPENRRNIIHARYYEQKSLRETGAAQGCTPEAVRQQEYHALRALRHPRHAKRLKPYYDALDLIQSRAHVGVGLSTFKHRGASQPEWLIEIMEKYAAQEVTT